MSIKAMTYIWEHCEESGSALLMMLALADHCNDDGECYPGVARLANKTRLSKRQAQNLLSKLESANEIKRELQTGIETGRGKTNRYHLIKYQDYIARGEVGNTPNGEGVKPIAPVGVKPVTPKPSVESSDKDTNVSKGTFNFNEYNQTIQDVFGVNGGRSTNLLHLMRGTSQTGDYKKYAITPAATIDELRGFKKWWTEKYDNATIPKSAEKIQDHFYAFRKFEERRKAAELARKASAAKIESIPEATPEQRQATAAAMKEARELMRKDKGA